MLLLDTCAFLWLEGPDQALTQAARDAVREHAGHLYVSAATAFEMALKHAKGRLRLPVGPAECYERMCRLHGVREIPIDGLIASRSAGLPFIHYDPCDRFIIATALEKKLKIVTADKVIPQYPGVRVIW